MPQAVCDAVLCPFAFQRRIIVRQNRFAEAAVGILHRAQPIRRLLAVECVEAKPIVSSARNTPLVP